MKKSFKVLFLLLFFNSLTSFSQAILNGTTLTVTDLTGNYVYYEHIINSSGGFVSSNGLGAPLNTPVKIKITSNGCSTNARFRTGDLNGSCDSYQTGSMNASYTEFITTLSNCCNPVAEGSTCNAINFGISIKCNSTSVGTSCIDYNTSTCCNLNCITFRLPANLPLCKKVYSAVIEFTDLQQTTVNVNFATGNTVMSCFTKPINRVVSGTFTSCNCTTSGPQPRQSIISEIENKEESIKIKISPNPSNSIVNFEGNELHKYKISIFDTNGKMIIENSKIDNTINIEKQAKGVYIYIITDGTGYEQKGKIIKN